MFSKIQNNRHITPSHDETPLTLELIKDIGLRVAFKVLLQARFSHFHAKFNFMNFSRKKCKQGESDWKMRKMASRMFILIFSNK
jgi:hypothetical protein